MTVEPNTKDKQITIDVPEDRVAEFYAFYGRFLAGYGRGRGRGRGPGGPGHRHGHGRHGCGHHDRPAEDSVTDAGIQTA
jgi:hypothetical protein